MDWCYENTGEAIPICLSKEKSMTTMQEVTLQQLFDAVIELSPMETCLVHDMEMTFRNNIEEIREHGYTEKVKAEWDEVAARYGVERTHRTAEKPNLTTVGGTSPTLH